MIKTYVKTAKVWAEQFDGSDEMIQRYGLGHFTDPQAPWIDIATLNGKNIFIGNWIITDSDREHKVIPDEVFKQAYAELSVIPKYVASIIEDYKANHDMGALMYVATQGTIDDGDFILQNTELVARAWLDGYRVGED